ncbi:ATP-binding protein [Pseudomonas sp. F1_0610]|uniref:AAA family ATPase n=1 Tax=Pseudomonas sp. F1_0610 TaxID=3114284 RepID=UPI0039C0B72C
MSQVASIANIGLCDVALQRALSRTESLPGMVCFYGPSGYGKTSSACYVANARRAYYVQARSVWTKKDTLRAIIDAIGVSAPTGATASMLVDAIASELAATGKPLIIDEMDHIVARGSVELIRDIYEASQSPILLIGEEMLPTKLKRFERFHGRVLSWVPAQPVSFEDAKRLVPIYSQVPVADDLLDLIVKRANGSVRRVATNLANISDTALNEGLDAVDLASWGKREIYTGEAPKRRA